MIRVLLIVAASLTLLGCKPKCEEETTNCGCSNRTECMLVTDGCFCPSECHPEIQCICGGGKFVRCETR